MSFMPSMLTLVFEWSSSCQGIQELVVKKNLLSLGARPWSTFIENDDDHDLVSVEKQGRLEVKWNGHKDSIAWTKYIVVKSVVTWIETYVSFSQLIQESSFIFIWINHWSTNLLERHSQKLDNEAVRTWIASISTRIVTNSDRILVACEFLSLVELPRDDHCTRSLQNK
jgi:hypothetical protein